MRKFCFAFLLSLFSLSGFAKHLVGGEIYYDCLGNNNYLITLKLYRDCNGGGAGYDAQASIGVFNSSGGLVNNLLVNFPGSTPVSYTPNPCLIPPSNICVEQATYTVTVNLPPSAGGYDIAYQRCCRNNTIINLTNAQNTGATYTCHIPDPSLATCNSSPRFDEFPPIFLCENRPLKFNHSATDPDGDSLVYAFADPYDGASAGNVMPQPPSAPAYSAVSFLAPYSAQYPVSSSPALAINGSTGMLTGTPNMLGQWVVGVLVQEYRKGKLLSSNIRDFQFNVISCPVIAAASIPDQTTFCNGMTVDFLNNSVSASTYHWDFGEPSLSNDTSNAKTPSWTYSAPGIYNVMLIVTPRTQCADTAYTTFEVYPLLDPSFVAGPEQCFRQNNFSFTAAGAFEGNGTFLWDFGSNASPATSTSQNPSNINFTIPGTYFVTLTVSENGCLKSYVDTVKINPQPDLVYNPLLVGGCSPFTVQFSDSSFRDTSITSVLWNFGDGITSSHPITDHTYITPGVYSVTVSITTNNYCLGKDSSFSVPGMVTVIPSPKAGLSADPLFLTVFDSLVTFTDLSHDATNCWIYFGDGDSSNNCGGTHLYPKAGEYTVTQVVENQYGCKEKYVLYIDKEVKSLFWIPNAFTPNHDGKNDLFTPVATGIQNYQMTIFDRWGNLIYKTDDIMKGWDGSFKGNRCAEDIYIWKVEFDNAGDHNAPHKMVGHVSLIF